MKKLLLLALLITPFTQPMEPAKRILKDAVVDSAVPVASSLIYAGTAGIIQGGYTVLPYVGAASLAYYGAKYALAKYKGQ